MVAIYVVVQIVYVVFVLCASSACCVCMFACTLQFVVRLQQLLYLQQCMYVCLSFVRVCLYKHVYSEHVYSACTLYIHERVCVCTRIRLHPTEVVGNPDEGGVPFPDG